ncbi:MAG: flagellar protein FliT [Pseudomonadota bacterium]
MMTSQDILSVYAAMADLTGQMVQAATRSDWDLLVLLEQRCAAHVQALREQEPQQPMQGADRERKIAPELQRLADARHAAAPRRRRYAADPGCRRRRPRGGRRWPPGGIPARAAGTGRPVGDG